MSRQPYIPSDRLRQSIMRVLNAVDDLVESAKTEALLAWTVGFVEHNGKLPSEQQQNAWLEFVNRDRRIFERDHIEKLADLRKKARMEARSLRIKP